MRTPNQRCGSCDAWIVDPTSIGADKQGTCHGDLPAVFQVSLRRLGGAETTGYQSVFPPMLESGWCRKWMPAQGYVSKEQINAELLDAGMRGTA